MVLTYQIARDDIIRALWRRMLMRPRYLRSLAFFALVAFATLLLWGDVDPYLGLLMGFWVGCRPFALRSAIVRMVNLNPALTDQRSLTLDDTGLTAEGPDWLIRVPWRHFLGWSEDPVYFFLEKSMSGIGPMIPKRAMSDAQQAMLRDYLAAAALKQSAPR
jgi:hypothetical protein